MIIIIAHFAPGTVCDDDYHRIILFLDVDVLIKELKTKKGYTDEVDEALNERYGKQMLELAKEIANDFERRMRSNKAFADSYEININDKTSSDCIINKRGIVNVVVIHWQEIVDTMAEMSNTDLYDSDADGSFGRYICGSICERGQPRLLCPEVYLQGKSHSSILRSKEDRG